MNTAEPIMTHPHDHIMANTWRLIFERKSRLAVTSPALLTTADFSLLEQVLPEYRLIGLCLAEDTKHRPN
jgi:hypothetical protein